MSGESEQWDRETIHRLARGISIEQELDQLRSDNARLKGEVDTWKWAVQAKDKQLSELAIHEEQFQNQLAQHLTDLQHHKDLLKVAGVILKECRDRLASCKFYPETANCHETKLCIEKADKALHTLSALTGDATKTP